jgi:hypothetical protein
MGGNVFEGRTTCIKQENIIPTLDSYFSELRRIFPNRSTIFNVDYFQPVGSVGKKAESGDIDLAIDTTSILDAGMSTSSIAEWGINPLDVDAEYVILEKRARTSSPSQLKMKAFLKTLASYANDHSTTLLFNQKKTTDGNLFSCYPQIDQHGNTLGVEVQIDWMIGNIKWLKFSYYSALIPPGSNVKGLHRTQLMLSAFQVANLSFNHVSGIKDKETGEVLATDPELALKILSYRLGVDLTQDDAENYYTLHSILKNGLSHNDYQKLLDIYFKILDSTRADIPDDLQTYWLSRRHVLDLSGKFLPEDSKLKGLL